MSDFWRGVARLYDLPPGVVQLENGNFGVMARPVRAAYAAHIDRVNRDGSYYTRRFYDADLAAVRARAAQALGVDAHEIVFTRGATEALQALIGGYANLKPGDGVLYADLDYDSMQTAMAWLAQRRGAVPVTIALPEPATRQGLIDAYAQAFDANPHVRLALLTHLSHRTGLVLPIAEIVAMARARGIDCIVDSAHAWGQIPFSLTQMGADFVGLNAHKWIGAPIGVGILYCRRSRIRDLENFMGEPGPVDSLDSKVHTGTANFAAFLTLPDALDFHEQIGAARKAERLRALRDRWAEPLRDHPAFEILTPADPALSGGLTSFRLRGKTSAEDARAIARRLLDAHKIFTVARFGVARGACVRVTPNVFTSEDDIDRLLAAVRAIARA
ncbi:MAG: aminotransferase class V-fold PLP-dependent enzyme [Alphaproteobacteria bacterium]|nr:aminotransferase class V-fold PLP-dependent enzyme [Alphaproteobacteria bacterium]